MIKIIILCLYIRRLFLVLMSSLFLSLVSMVHFVGAEQRFINSQFDNKIFDYIFDNFKNHIYSSMLSIFLSSSSFLLIVYC